MVRLRRVAPARTPELISPVLPSSPAASFTKKDVVSNAPLFWMLGVSPVWGNAHRNLNAHISVTEVDPGAPSSIGGCCVCKRRVWLPATSVESLGLKLTDPKTPRVPSAWGDLISGEATSDPSLLSYESFQARRFPLHVHGTTHRPLFSRLLQKLMIDAPSEFPSLYWGMLSEFEAAGAKVLPGAHGVNVNVGADAPVELFNAAQTTMPYFFTPERCVAYSPLLIPEMKHEYLALSFYWDTVRRGRVNCCDEWFSKDFVVAAKVQLRNNARAVGGRYNMWDFKDIKHGHKLKQELAIKKKNTSGR